MDATALPVITLRKASPEDLDDILAMDRQYSPVYRSPEQYARYLSPPGLLFVAAAKEGLAGFALWDQLADESTLLNLVVSKRCQRIGLAKRLLAEGERLLAERGVQRVMLEVREGNVAANTLYRALAFSIDGKRKGYYPGKDGHSREDAVLMSKKLEALGAST